MAVGMFRVRHCSHLSHTRLSSSRSSGLWAALSSSSRLSMLCPQILRAVQCGVHAVLRQEFLVGALFGDDTVLYHQYPAGRTNGGQPVGDDQCRAASGQTVKEMCIRDRTRPRPRWCRC